MNIKNELNHLFELKGEFAWGRVKGLCYCLLQQMIWGAQEASFGTLMGSTSCVGDGAMTPLTMVILGGLMNDYGSSSPSSETVDTVNTQPRVKILIWEYILAGIFVARSKCDKQVMLHREIPKS